MAARFLVAGGSGLWNNNNNWAATSGGGSGASFPVSGDTVTIDNASLNANISVNVISQCTSFTITGTYTGTVNLSASLVVAGSFTLVSTMTLTTSSVNNQFQFTASGTLTSGGIIIPCGIRFGSGSGVTFTLGDNWTVSGSVQINGNNTTTQTLNSNQMTINGGLQCGISFLNTLSGTTTIVMGGTGTLTCLNSSVIKNTLTINTSGTITLGAAIRYNTGTFTYTAGTIVTTNSTFAINGSATLNTSGITFNNISIITSSTVTINSLLRINGTLTITATTIFAGTSGWITMDFTCVTAGTSITYKAGIVYLMTDMLILTGTLASNIIFISSTPGTRYTFTLLNNGTSTNDVGYVNATDADSSLGSTIWNYPGSISNTLNWNLLTGPQTIGTGHIM